MDSRPFAHTRYRLSFRVVPYSKRPLIEDPKKYFDTITTLINLLTSISRRFH
jgi:hypothetical protein